MRTRKKGNMNAKSCELEFSEVSEIVTRTVQERKNY